MTVVDDTTTAISQALPAASATVWRSGSINKPSISFDPNTNGKFVIVATQGSKPTVRIGNVSGSTLTYGSFLQTGPEGQWTAVAYDPFEANKFILTFADTDNGGIQAIVGTVSGNTISLGSITTVRSANAQNVRIAFDKVTSGKFIISLKQCFQT